MPRPRRIQPGAAAQALLRVRTIRPEAVMQGWMTELDARLRRGGRCDV